MAIPNFSLTSDGEAFIRKHCNGSGNSLLRGKKRKILPFADGVTSDTVWTSDPNINGGITTNGQLGENLIDWYNLYCNEAKIDANMMAIQTFLESSYIVWNYPITDDITKESTSMSLGQFLMSTFYEAAIGNNYDSKGGLIITTDERNRLTVGLPIGFTNDKNYYIAGSKYIPYRKILFQNVIDNPKISIKLQVRYMNYIANLTSQHKLASNALFGYNRGPALIKNTYFETVANTRRKKGDEYTLTGINYVHKVFRHLYDSFGNKELGMDIPISEFNTFTAGVDSSNHYS